ncbi:MAG: hypothetical protein Q8L57_02580 [bacterium]|nr:hypothetical protein [bacterium]
MEDCYFKIAKILRTQPEVVFDMDKKMSAITGKKNVIAEICEENDRKVRETLKTLGLASEPLPSAEEVYKAVIAQIKGGDQELFELFNEPSFDKPESCEAVCEEAKKLAAVPAGFFLKKERAAEILRDNPPPNIIQGLGYKDVEELLAKENLFEVFSALRFVESKEWMHEMFQKVYTKIRPADFEFREIEILPLHGKWLKLAEKFMKKKYHNVSHLKELGIIFVIPLPIDTPGEILRIFGLLLHYFHEITFYSEFFQKIAKEENFTEKFISLLRGDVSEGALPNEGRINWRILQQYLAKDNENDLRLFEPHISPEAMHWEKAERDVEKLAQRYPGLGLGFWTGLNWIGDFFISKNTGKAELVSFDLIDNVMAVVMEKAMIKYLYHHQEALWNRIFIGYFGEAEMERMIKENLIKGYITF